jgi:hypothetical protein
MEMVDRDSLVPSPHPDRRSQAYLPNTTEALADVSQLKGAAGYRVERLFRCLLLQVMEDLWIVTWHGIWKKIWPPNRFVRFPLSEPTPAYSLFTRVRTRIGPTRLSPLVATMREQLKAAGLRSEVFTFVDATHLIAKATRGEERDKARQQNIEKLNNEVLPKVAVDTQARIGCTGKKKYGSGEKEPVSVDMQSGLINKVATPPLIFRMPRACAICPTRGRWMRIRLCGPSAPCCGGGAVIWRRSGTT